MGRQVSSHVTAMEQDEGGAAAEVEVATVDGFQGREKVGGGGSDERGAGMGGVRGRLDGGGGGFHACKEARQET